ncbi:hypothetical protein HMPREF9136_0841 [Prevotella dentalis DSM 3688]|uniref:Uncharacterized protein n=1 Tax=Prevotella dentalis (strain ATCC 49559 / DSM 3688 / JCM 13448 / NCTC 12043 / ES 2772) TaxID=908937 RepID=F9D1W3_PREDD|nr:hypothetical protein HMPREF9136_0841 [Prevotella dentalis DSM 3688]
MSLSFERDAVCNVLAPVRVRSCWQRQLGTTDNNIYAVAQRCLLLFVVVF